MSSLSAKTAVLLACLAASFATSARANFSCPAELAGVPLIPGREGEPQPGEAFEIAGSTGSYTANCSYQAEDLVIRIIARWHPMEQGLLFGCADLRGLPEEQETSDETGYTLRSKDRQAVVDTTVTDKAWKYAAKAQGATMLEEAAGMAATCRAT